MRKCQEEVIDMEEKKRRMKGEVQELLYYTSRRRRGTLWRGEEMVRWGEPVAVKGHLGSRIWGRCLGRFLIIQHLAKKINIIRDHGTEDRPRSGDLRSLMYLCT